MSHGFMPFGIDFNGFPLGILKIVFRQRTSMKALEGLDYLPRWITHMGCVKSCTDYLGLGISEPWIYGGTGHAFILNISKDSCPSGPTAWKSEKLFKLGRNLGYDFDGVFAHKSMPDFKEKQKTAYDLVVRAIDMGYPCYGWELSIAEFSLVYGYDEKGVYHKGPDCMNGTGLKRWQELGDTNIGIVEMYSLKPGMTEKDETTVKEALEFALEHAENPMNWIFPNYSSGLKGYDLWMKGIEEQAATLGGIAYNAQCWKECREKAVEFLQEAKQKLNIEAKLLDEAVNHYTKISETLNKVTEIYPFSFPPDFVKTIKRDERIPQVLEALGNARDAEAEGLESLRAILDAL